MMLSYEHPITLGKHTLHSNIVQGPLAGYSCAPFRELTWQQSRPGLCVTEMISATDIVLKEILPQRYLFRSKNEGPLSYQLSGQNTEHLSRATDILNTLGADFIDLNAGCPVNKIRKKQCGSSLLAHPEALYQSLQAIRQQTDATVSVKIRISAPLGDHDDFAVIDAATAANVDFITVHGRHWTQRYDVDCDLVQIKRIVDYTDIPIFANGDVDNYNSAQETFNKTGCAGIMIARASVGRPWLFNTIRDNHYVRPSIEEIGRLFIHHLEGLARLENPHVANLQARKLAKYYANNLRENDEFIQNMHNNLALTQSLRCIERFFVSDTNNDPRRKY